MAVTARKSMRYTLAVIYVLAAVLMVIRVDWWWWGIKIQPLIFGWMSVPMIYQLGIWLAGTALVFWLCLSAWKQGEQE